MASVGIPFPNSTRTNYTLDVRDVNVLLDTGATLSHLHGSVVARITRDLNALDLGSGRYYAACSLRSQPGGINFVFGRKTVTVPFSDFIRAVSAPGARDMCRIGLSVAAPNRG